jgi:hypothetical protein
MSRRHWIPVIVTLACLPSSRAEAQLLSDPATLRHTYNVQAAWADSLATSRHEAALRFLAVAEEILSSAERSNPERAQLLVEAQVLADRLASLDQEIGEANTMVRETKARLLPALESRATSVLRAAADASPPERRELEAQARNLEAEVEALREGEGNTQADDPLDSAVGPLSAMARLVAEEHERLENLQILQEELRLLLSDLRLFDGTSMPPSARAGGGDDPASGCQPSACALGGASPADLPLTHSQPADPGSGQGRMAMTPTSLARLHEQIAAYVEVQALPSGNLARDDPVVTREVVLGAGIMAFRGDGSSSNTPGPKATTSLLFSWPLGENVGLAVGPSVGARVLRGGSSTFTELVGEVRETLSGTERDGRLRWLVSSWQKGRFLSEPLSPPGYLEPGRAEAGLIGRFSFFLGSEWQLDAEGGANGVRYEPEEWSGLDRHGLTAALGLAWSGVAHSARLVVRTSHHGFPHSLADWEERREDTRVGLELSGSLEGKLIARLSVGGSWNESRIPAYDFRLGRAALVLSAPWGKGSLQGYAALAYQQYLNPGPEAARVAPSDQDSGSVVSLQYTYPLDPAHMLIVRGGWSRSQTGFRNEFYERFGMSLHLAFKGS